MSRLLELERQSASSSNLEVAGLAELQRLLTSAEPSKAGDKGFRRLALRGDPT